MEARKDATAMISGHGSAQVLCPKSGSWTGLLQRSALAPGSDFEELLKTLSRERETELELTQGKAWNGKRIPCLAI